jgi:hypothetical protein
MIVEFKKAKETKNTVKYDEVQVAGKPPVIGTLYVQKWFADDKTTLTVEIKE